MYALIFVQTHYRKTGFYIKNKKISTRLLTVLIISVIVRVEQR